MDRVIGWNFPGNNNGQLTGISEAGIETFKGSLISSLTREICQNSLDAIKYKNKPVIVEFEKYIIKNSEIPGYDKLKDTLEKCRLFWNKQNNIKAISFFNKAISTINKQKVSVLRISDYNTIGLTGSDKLYNTPWSNLVKSNGVSNKGESSGGSFGIGKSASFACSDLRTVFYRTLDENNIKAAQGVCKLASFENQLNNGDYEITTGIGYYGDTHKNTSVLNIDTIDKLNYREKCGTDIFIVGFMCDNNWKESITIEVLESFLLSIINGNMIVKIENQVIDKNEIENLMNRYKDKLTEAYSYYRVIKSPNTKTITCNFENMGTVNLKVLIEKDLRRKVLISRSNGMKLFDKKSISSTIQFSGILNMEGKEINQFFRSMESPQHNAWEVDRYEGTKNAKELKKKLFKWIKDNILKEGRYGSGEEIDAEGVGEFIPDFFEMGKMNENNGTKESISDITKSLEIKIYDKQVNTSTIDKELDLIGDEDSTGILDENGVFDTEDEPSGPPNNSDGGKGKDAKGSLGDGNRQIKVGKEIKECNMKLFISNKDRNEYTLLFDTIQDIMNGYLSIKISGEQSNLETNVKSAFNKNTKEILKCKNEKIFIKNIKKSNKNKVLFTLSEDELYSLEVKLYAN